MTADLKPDSTAVRAALWRAMHVQVDALCLNDSVGLDAGGAAAAEFCEYSTTNRRWESTTIAPGP
jgi:hypothetical protein